MEDEISNASDTCERKEKCIQLSMGKPEVQKPLQISRSKLENNIKSQLKSVLRVDWIHLAQDRDMDEIL
jgi:hypothetical protein